MKQLHRVWALANVRPEEVRLVQLVLLLAALNGITRLLGNTAAFALFLDVLDAQSLPLIYIGSSLVSTLVSVLYLRLEQRYSLAQLVVGQMAFFLVTLIAYRLGLALTMNRWLVFTLPIYDGAVSALLYMTFWNLLGRIFNLQQGKRFFSLFGAAQELATIVMGFGMPLLVMVVGTSNLLWGAALSCVGALGVLLLITREAPAVHAPSAEAEVVDDGSDQPAPRRWLTDPYVALILAMCICFGFGDYFVDNIFYARVEGQLTNPAQLASFLGIFASCVSALSLGSHLFLSSYMLRRYGVRVIILLTPLLLLVMTGLYVISGLAGASALALFWLAVVTNLIRQVTDTFDNTATNLLYQPLPPTVRMRTQTTIDGILYPVAGGAAGLLLLFLTHVLQFDALQLAYVLLPLVVIWLLANWALGRAYPQRVQQALRQRTVRGDSTFIPDRASLQLLQQHLQARHPGGVLYALDLLATHAPAAMDDVLPALLHHPTVAVRLAAIRQIEARGTTARLATLEAALPLENDAVVQSALLRAVAAIGGLRDNEDLHSQLAAPNLLLRQGAMVGLLRSGDLEGILAVGAQLAQLVASPLPAERIFAAQVLGESGIPSFYRPLLQLLKDPLPSVRRAALVASAKLEQPKLWPFVVEALAYPETRAAAQTALVAGGEQTLAAVASGWAAAAADPAFRLALARTCGRLRSAGAAAQLVAALDEPDVNVRTQILAALNQCTYQAAPAERPRFEAAIRAELSHAAWTLAGIVDLINTPALHVVQAALQASLQQQQTRLFYWLGLLYDPAVVRRVRETLMQQIIAPTAAGAEQRAYALEALDLLVAGDYKKPLLALWDEQPPLPKLTQLAPVAPQPRLGAAERLQAILMGPRSWLTPWLQATALYHAPAVARQEGALFRQGLALAAAEAVVTSNALVRESAQWAIHHLASIAAGAD